MVYSAVFAFILPILLYDNSEIEFKVDYVGRTMFAAGVASIWVMVCKWQLSNTSGHQLS